MSTTIGPGGSLIWDYPPQEEANVDTFEIYLDGDKKKSVPPSTRSVPIQDLTSTPGDKTAAVAPRNALGEASKAEVDFRLVTGIPVPVTNVRVGIV